MQSNTAIYGRKSSESEDRQVLSLESQDNELTALAAHQKLTIFSKYIEAKSAKAPGRPIFNKLISDIESGSVQRILVWHPDRLSRNPIDTGRLIYLFDLGKLHEIITPSQTFTNTPNDKFMLNLLCGQAKLENDNRGINTKRGLKTKAEKGALPNGAKPGYMNDKYADKGDKKVLKDPQRFPIIRKCWELLLSGAYNVPQILQVLNEDMGYRSPTRRTLGGKRMSRSQLYKMFRDTYYYGEFEYPEKSGNWYSGTHEPMVTKEEFDRVQVLLGRKGRIRTRKHQFPLSGLMICGDCGAAITAEEKWQLICSSCKTKFSTNNKDACPNCHVLIEQMKRPTVLHYTYYHCTKRKDPHCKQKSVRSEVLDTQIDQLLSSIGISEQFKDWAIKYLNEINDHEVETRTATLDSLQSAYSDCVNRLDNLVKLKISPNNADSSLLSDDEFKKQKDLLATEKAALEEKLADTGQRIDKWINDAEAAFEFAIRARDAYTNGTITERKQILCTLGSNLILKDGMLRCDLQKPYLYMKEAINSEAAVSAMFEPTKKGLTEAQLWTLYSQNPTLLPEPWINITIDFESIIQAFQDLRFIGEMRQRWNEIKKLQITPGLALS